MLFLHACVIIFVHFYCTFLLFSKLKFSVIHMTVVSSKTYDKRDDFDFDIHVVNFPFLDGDVPRRPSLEYTYFSTYKISRVCSHVAALNARNKCLTAKLLKQVFGTISLVARRWFRPQTQ